jgi:parallel beta-helix repeat protein
LLKRLSLVGCALAACAAGATPALAAPAGAGAKNPTLYVSTGGSDTNPKGTENTCRLKSNPCLTIEHAIGEAPTTATISVGAGDYPEQLTIGSNLTIVGAGAGTTVIDPTALQTTTNDPNHDGVPQRDIVTFDGSASGGLSGALKNLTVDGSGYTEDTCNADYIGVYVLDASATLSGDAVSDVEHDPGSAGCQQGPNGGIYVANDDATTGASGNYTVTMSSDTVSGYTKNGITCRDIDTSCSIATSKVTGAGPTGVTAQNGIELYDLTNASVSGTTVNANTYTDPNYTSGSANYANASGVLAINDGTLTLTGNFTKSNDENIVAIEDQADFAAGPDQGNWSITGNSATAASNDSGQASGSDPVPTGFGIGDGIDVYGASSVSVFGNTVSGNADWGIALFGVSYSNIGGSAKHQPNTASKNGDDGIYVGEYLSPSHDNTIADNVANGNADDGILADGPDTDGNQQDAANQFLSNTLQNNIRYDAEDRSTGSGTAGTNNTWSGNLCKPALDGSPAGICS